MLGRSHRYLRMAGALALASGSLLSGGVPVAAAANITIGPMLLSKFGSATQPLSPAECVATFTVPCYGPDQVQTAYNEQPLFNSGITGKGQTIVIVDSFGSPTIQADLAPLTPSSTCRPRRPSRSSSRPGRSRPGTPRTPTATSAGPGRPPWTWSGRTAWRPGANILLVETPVAETEGTAGLPQIVEAENYVIDHHLGQVISQSFGATEGTFPSVASIAGLRSAYFNAQQNHVTVLAATGDAGATDYSNDAGTLLYTHRAVDWPSTDPLVTAVGGTQLALLDDGSRTSPTRCGTTATTTPCNNVFDGSPARRPWPPAAASRRSSPGRGTRTGGRGGRQPAWRARTSP